MMVRRIVLGVALAMSMASCAEYAQFRSVPQPASVYLNEQLIGRTPLEHPIATDKMDQPYDYRIEFPGYQPASGTLRRETSRGRIVAAVFSLGISRAFRGFDYFERVSVVLAPDAAAPPHRSQVERLRELDDARNKGLISDAEYDTLRAEILNDF